MCHPHCNAQGWNPVKIHNIVQTATFYKAPTNGHIQTYPHTPSIHHSKYIVAECKARVNIKSQHHVISVEIMGYKLAQTDRTVQLKHRGIRKHDIPVHTWQMLHIVLHTFCITNDYHPSSYHITSAYICLFSQGLPNTQKPPKTNRPWKVQKSPSLLSPSGPKEWEGLWLNLCEKKKIKNMRATKWQVTGSQNQP